MSVLAALLVFLVSLAAMSLASVRLTAALERVGGRLAFSDALLGLVTALGADAPEICSASVALLAGRDDVGLGVVLGSNIFNIAGLLGLSALVAGRVEVGRQGLWLNGGLSLLVSGLVFALVFGWTDPSVVLALLLLLLVPYVVLLSRRGEELARLRLPRPVRRFLSAAVEHAHHNVRGRRAAEGLLRVELLRVVLYTGVVVLASVAAVRSAVLLGAEVGLGDAVVGTVILAALTSVPNVIAAVRLAQEGRGGAVVSEALNSNTLNVLAGICLPAVVLGFARPGAGITLAASWLLGMKLVALVAASHRRGLHRAGGVVLVLLYAAFVLLIVSGDVGPTP